MSKFQGKALSVGAILMARSGANVRRLSRSKAAFGLMALCGLIMGFAAPAPANAGAFDGDITNRLPSSYTVKIADLERGTSSCSTWNAGTFNCTHWWLPSGKSDDQIRGRDFDTDAFMVEQRVLLHYGLLTRYVDAFVWTKIPDASNVNCYLNPGPVCRVNL